MSEDFDWITYRVGRWMKSQRKKKRWSQERLGEIISLHRNRISRWENGESDVLRPITLMDFVMLCDTFGTDPCESLLDIIREPRSTIKVRRCEGADAS